MEISEFIALPLISIHNGNLIGNIENILFDAKTKKCIYITIFNEKDNMTYAIKPQSIYKLGKDCVFIKNESCLNIYENLEPQINEYSNPINSKVYSFDGDYMGVISNIFINNNFLISHITINNNDYLISNFLTLRDNISVYSEKKVIVSNFKHKNKSNIIAKNDLKITIENSNENIIKPPKLIASTPSILLNKTTTKNIIKSNGEIIIKSGTKITPSTIENAKLNGKLLELSQFCK